MPGPLRVAEFGPFTKGVIDGANPELDLTGALRYARDARLDGVHRVRAGLGTLVAMTFADTVPAPNVGFTRTVCAVAPFKDRVLVVAHEPDSRNVYLFLLDAAITGWYSAADVFTADTTAGPIGILWSGIDTPPVVRIAEGLGVAYLAHAAAADSASLNWPTKTLALSGGAWTIGTLTSDVNNDATAESLYFSGVVSFQQHLWGWGFGSGTTPDNGFRPELARFSKAIFDSSADPHPGDLFAPSDSLTLGDRVRSVREGIIAAAVAGDALYLASNRMVTRIVGSGRDSWFRTVLDRAYGVVGPQALCGAGDAVYGWAARGLWRIPAGATAAEPLWDAIPETVAAVANGGAPENTIVAFDPDHDRVAVIYQADAADGRQRLASFDLRRNVWLGPDTAIGMPIFSAASTAPVYTVTSPPTGPSAAPTAGTATNLTSTSARLPWTNGDATASTEVWTKRSTDANYALRLTAQPGVARYDYTGLAASTTYNWEVRHTKNGQVSGFSVGAAFTTAASGGGGGGGPSLAAPTNPGLEQGTTTNARATWSNNGSSAETELWLAGPSNTQPTDADFALIYTAPGGAASHDFNVTNGSGTYWLKARHVDSTASSDFAGPTSSFISTSGAV